MEVYVLIDRGEFVAVFATAELAMKYFNTRMAFYGLKPEWESNTFGNWYVKLECKVGCVSVTRRMVVNS